MKKDTSSKKIKLKRAKNIDSYTGTTIQSNINTMGESKISKFFKEKFNNLRNKVRKQKDEIIDNKTIDDNKTIERLDSEEDITNTNLVEEIENSEYNDTLNGNLKVNQTDNIENNETQHNTDKLSILDINSPTPVQEHEIRAK